MAKLRSAYEFVAHIQQEAAWRKRELSQLDGALGSASGPWEASLARMGIVMLCAHWEGFVKIATTTYLEYVEQQVIRNGVAFDAMAPHFRGLALWKTFSATNASALIAFTEVIAAYFATSSAKPNIPTDIIATKSNLTAKRFKRILRTLGLRDSSLESRAVIIQEKIVKKRHLIAHGGRYGEIGYSAVVGAKDYAALSVELVAGLDELSTILEDAAVNKAHLA